MERGIMTKLLPTEKGVGGYSGKRLVWYIYGPPGIGKTTFAASMEDPLFLYMDSGARNVNTYKLPIFSWQDFTKAVTILREERPQIYGTVVVDGVDALFRFCRRSVCAKRGIEHVSDEGYGKAYDLLHDEFEQAMARLTLLPYSVVFIAHSKEIEIRGRALRTSKMVPSTPRSAHSLLSALADVLMFCGYLEKSADDGTNERRAFFAPTETVEAKDRTGLLPESCGLDYAVVKSYLTATRRDDEKPSSNTLLRKKGVLPLKRSEK